CMEPRHLRAGTTPPTPPTTKSLPGGVILVPLALPLGSLPQPAARATPPYRRTTTLRSAVLFLSCSRSFRLRRLLQQRRRRTQSKTRLGRAHPTVARRHLRASQ